MMADKPAGAFFSGDWIENRRDGARPVPPADSTDVLLKNLGRVRSMYLLDITTGRA
jgi:hypothetical protein